MEDDGDDVVGFAENSEDIVRTRQGRAVLAARLFHAPRAGYVPQVPTLGTPKRTTSALQAPQNSGQTERSRPSSGGAEACRCRGKAIAVTAVRCHDQRKGQLIVSDST